MDFFIISEILSLSQCTTDNHKNTYHLVVGCVRVCVLPSESGRHNNIRFNYRTFSWKGLEGSSGQVEDKFWNANPTITSTRAR